jgi:predicted alpha/beta-fold hydrolase
LEKELGKIEELILFGFSAGGVVASHVMEKCKNMTCKKKIITYDTPWQVHHNVDSFKNNWVYRFDILFFWKVFNVYANHYNYEDIKHHLKDKKWHSGSDEINKLIKDVHNCSHETFLKMTEFNFDQTHDTKVYNIYSQKDIFAIHEISDKFVDKNRDKIKFFNKNIEKNTIGHCSDMAFSTEYLMDIMVILFSNESL